MIQESKLKEVDLAIIGSMWQKEKVGWSFSRSKGRSGGMKTMWKEGKMEIIFSFSKPGILGTKMKHLDRFFYIVNIYSPCSLQGKKDLWEEILKLRITMENGCWEATSIQPREVVKGKGAAQVGYLKIICSLSL